MFLRVLYAIPVLGWLLRDAAEGSDDAPIFFLVNLAMMWLLSALFFGYPGIIIPALVAVPVVFAVLIWISRDR